jgi:hypothetical protein
MAKLSISSDRIDISLGAFEALQALQTSFSLKLSDVRGATEDTEYIRSGLGLRSPGTGFPGLIAKGIFRKHGQKVLSLWSRGQEIVVIELVNSKWDRVLFGCDNANELVSLINQAKARQL